MTSGRSNPSPTPPEGQGNTTPPQRSESNPNESWPDIPELPPAPPMPDFPEPRRPAKPEPSPLHTHPGAMSTLYRVGGIGFDLAATIVVFGLLGYAADRFLNLAPSGIVAGLGVGLIVGFIRLIRTAARLSRES